ncbi:putative inactive 1-aminocyclopropane-1-carboxylate synthase-like protein 2 [Ctenodactylus gundi]
MSRQVETFPWLGGQKLDQILQVFQTYNKLMDKMLNLQQAVREHFVQLTATQMLNLSLHEEKQAQAVFKEKENIEQLMSQVTGLLWPEAMGSLMSPRILLSRDNGSDAGGSGVETLSFRRPNRLGPRLRDHRATFVHHIMSNRGVDISQFFHSSFQDYESYQRDKYHEDTNTLGFLNLATSENRLCLDLMTERLCQSDMNHMEETLLQYPDWSGHPFLREEVAQFLTYYCKAPAPLDPQNVVVLNGCCAVFSALAMVLCDPGEAFLIPSPFYYGLAFSSLLYANIELILVDLESKITGGTTQPFQLTVDKMEQTLQKAQAQGKKVRGLVLINPQNPLGDVYSRPSVKEYLDFAKRNHLHVIVDEIYMLSVFDESVTFHSVLSMDSLPDPIRTHVIWGTSKDFGISGFRFGALYTHNKEVASAMGTFGYLHSSSGITQYKLSRLLQDREWIDKVYLPTNHFRLRAAHAYVTETLKQLNVPFLHRGSGLYIWINLKAYLDPCTFEEELRLHHRFLDSKLMLTRGASYLCKEPGWFRLVFAESPLRLKVAMYRFRQVLLEQKQEWVEKQLEDAMKEEPSASAPEPPELWRP